MDLNVYFVRHGLSLLNKKNTFQAKTTPLSKQGKHQANLVADRLARINASLIYSSDLIRAKQTAQIISKKLNIKIEHTNLLNEWSKPSQLANLSFDDPKSKKIITLFQANRHDPNYKYSDDESFHEIVDRVRQALNHLVTHHSNQTIIAVTHAHFLRLLLLYLLHGDNFDQQLFWHSTIVTKHDNTGVSHFRFTSEDAWKLITWNDIIHL